MKVNIRYRRPWLYPRQRAAIFSPARYAVIEASTKSGKTVGCMTWLLEEALRGRAGMNYWWVAPVYLQARIAFRRMQRLHFTLGGSGGAGSLFGINRSALTITLPNGAVLWFKSAEKPDNLYGEDVFAAVLDEASRMREDSWHAVRTTLTATRGPVRIIGNVKGKKNWAYLLARKAEAGEPGMSYAKLTAYDAVAAIKPNGRSVLAAAEVADAKRVLPPRVFAELYEAVASDDGGNPFGDVRAHVRPLSALPTVWWGIDLGKAQDYTVLIGLDENGQVTAVHRWQRPWIDTKRWILAAVADRPTLVDSTGLGDPIVEDLHAVRANIEGYTFTLSSKQRLMEGLASAIQENLLWYPEGVVLNELDLFEYEYVRSGVRYSAPQGMHDDCVCALALAQECRRTRRYAPVRLWGGPLSDDEDSAA